MSKTVEIHIPQNFRDPRFSFDSDTQISLIIASLSVLIDPEIKSSARKESVSLILKILVPNWKEMFDALDGAATVKIYTGKISDGE